MRRLAGFAVLGVCLMSPYASARPFSAVQLRYAAPGASGGGVGAVATTVPRYAGSDETRTLALPIISYQWANGAFAGVDNGAGFNLSTRPDRLYGVRLTADFGRSEGSSPALRGMGDVPARLEAGLFASAYLGEHWLLSGNLRHGSGQSSDGTVLDASAQFSMPLGSRWSWSVRGEASWANGAHLQNHFGVDAAQAVRSGYAQYTPGAGLREAQISASLNYALQERTHLIVGVQGTRLLGDAAHSPLVRARQSNTATLVLVRVF